MTESKVKSRRRENKSVRPWSVTSVHDSPSKKHVDMRRFVIGDMVWVDAVVDAFYEPGGRRCIERMQLEEPICGQIVGLTRIQIGKYNDGGWPRCGMDSLDPPDPVPPYLDVKGQETVWLVRFGMLNKPVKVLDGDVRRAENSEVMAAGFKLPLMYQRRREWPQDLREALSRESKNWPRDERGRWKKEGS